MEDLKIIIAKNIIVLRKKQNLTQLELAEKLNYSDKAISKWERGESIPDVIVLKQIADLFNVSVDYLLEKEHKAPINEQVVSPIKRNNKVLITWISIFFVCLVATCTIMIAKLLDLDSSFYWLPFIYALPVISILGIIFNSIWFNPKLNYLIISILLWSILAAIYLTYLVQGSNLWIIFILGIPGQGIILLWSGIRYKSLKEKN